MLKKVMVILILLGITGCLDRPKSRKGDFNAVVLDSMTEEPVPGVNVSIGDKPYTTDLKGQISLAGLSPGDYRIRMIREWYHTKDISYNHLGKPEPVNFYLKPLSLPGRIYYSIDKDKNKNKDREIYEIILENRSINKVLSLPESDETNPAWSANGKLAIESTIGKDSDIFLYDISEGKPKYLLRQKGEHPSLDMDGTNMVCKTLYDSSLKIVLYKNNSPLKSFEKSGYYPAISPDGTMVVYVSGDYQSLYICSGSNLSKYTPGADYKISNPCWSPDGSKIAFEAYTNSKGQRAIYYISVNGNSFSTMYKITRPLGQTEKHTHPTWDDSGNIIYFSRSNTYSSHNEIYAVKFDECRNEQDITQWVMVSKGPGSKDYPCWGK